MARSRNVVENENTEGIEIDEAPVVDSDTEFGTEVEAPEVEKPRIPDLLSSNNIFNHFCERYVETADKLAAYNKEIFASKDSEWSPGKLIEKAREFASPDNANEVKPAIKSALDAWEDLYSKTILARKELISLTAGELGITLTNTAERNPEVEAPLKEERKMALTIANQLEVMAGISNDEAFTQAVAEFLMNTPLPQVGRDQVTSFGDGGKATPKYRVTVTVTSVEGKELVNADGFTKAALALTKPEFGYERGKSLTSANLREAWEKAGNNAEKTTQPVVEFTDNDLLFKIVKK